MKIRSFVVLFTVMVMSLGSAQLMAGWLDKLSEVVKDNQDKIPSSLSSSSSDVSLEDMSAAFKQALDIGSKKVVDQLGKTDGFNGDSNIRIPLPEKMQTVKGWLAKVGLDGQMDDLV